MYVEMEEYLKRRESHVTMELQAWRAMEEEKEMSSSSKRRKFYSEMKNDVRGGGEVEPATTENSVSPAASRTISGVSDVHHEEFSSDLATKRSSDLENVDNLQSAESVGTEISSSDVDRVFSREATPICNELYGDSEQITVEPLSTSKEKRSWTIYRRKIAEIGPSASELEEFFAAAEKFNRKGFAEKYNYDIAKDVPLEGKYQWVRLHP